MNETERRRALYLAHALVRDDDFHETDRGYVDPERVKETRLRIEARWAAAEAARDHAAAPARATTTVFRFAR